MNKRREVHHNDYKTLYPIPEQISNYTTEIILKLVDKYGPSGSICTTFIVRT